MTVRHILKDGTETDSVEGLMISPDDCPEFYDILGRVCRKEADGKKDNTERPGRVA